jgi:hypothetical protein
MVRITVMLVIINATWRDGGRALRAATGIGIRIILGESRRSEDGAERG